MFFSLVFLVSISPFHLNTSVNCMHFFFFFGAMFCIKLEFLIFLHCNYNTSLFDLLKSVGLVVLFCHPSCCRGELCCCDPTPSSSSGIECLKIWGRHQRYSPNISLSKHTLLFFCFIDCMFIRNSNSPTVIWASSMPGERNRLHSKSHT